MGTIFTVLSYSLHIHPLGLSFSLPKDILKENELPFFVGVGPQDWRDVCVFADQGFLARLLSEYGFVGKPTGLAVHHLHESAFR